MKDVLLSIIGFMAGFRPQFVFLENEDGLLTARALDPSQSIFMQLYMEEWENIGDNKVILGNLPYLQRLLKLPAFNDDGQIKLIKDVNYKGKEVFTKIEFTSPKVQVEYLLTDESIANVRVPSTFKFEEKASAIISQEKASEFRQVAMLHRQAVDKAEKSIVYPTYTDDSLLFEFPSTDTNIVVEVSDQIEGRFTEQVAYSADRVKQIMALFDQYDGGTLSISDNAIKAEIVHGEHLCQICLPKNVRRNSL